MRILAVNPYFHPHPGGSQRYIEDLYAHVRQIDPSIQVDVLTYNTDNVTKSEEYRGFTIYRVSCVQVLPGQFALPNYVELVSLARKLKQNNYSVVNAHVRFFDASWWAADLAAYLGAKAVLTDHTAATPTHNSAIVNQITKRVDQIMIPYLSNKYHHVTVVSQATKKFLKQMGMKHKIEVIHGGVEVSFFEKYAKAKKMPKFSGKIHKDAIKIGFVARMIPGKGPHLLFEAVQSLAEKENIQVFFAGNGELYNKLKSRATKRIHFLGLLNRQEVAECMNQLDILVQPSVHHEGLPITLLEAGAAHCAAIATDRGGVTEVIKDTKTGLIVDSTAEDVHRGLEILIHNSKLRDSLAHNLNSLVKKQFDWSIIAEEYYEFLKQITK